MATRYVRAEDTFISPDGTPKPPTAQGSTGGGSKKKLFILAGGGLVLLFIVIIVAVLVASGGGGSEKPDSASPSATLVPTNSAPSATPTISPTRAPTPTKEPGRIPISGVSVYDFTGFAQGVLPNGDVLIVRNDEYQIVYIKSTSAFTITILVENFLMVREEAEEEFIGILGITKEAACRLTVTVGSPSHINSRYAGLSFPLSWCGE